MLAAMVFFFFFFFFFGGGGGGEECVWSPLSSTKLLKEPLNPEQQTHQPFRGINSRITKCDKILEYFLTLILFGREMKR